MRRFWPMHRRVFRGVECLAVTPDRIEDPQIINLCREIERWLVVVQTVYEEGINFTDPRATCEAHLSTGRGLPMRPRLKTAPRLIMRHSVITGVSMGRLQPSAQADSRAPGCAEALSGVGAA
jgi:hypothetical protein